MHNSTACWAGRIMASLDVGKFAGLGRHASFHGEILLLDNIDDDGHYD